MPNFATYPAPWTGGVTDSLIGPDGNLWVVNNTAQVYVFNTTTLATTTIVVTNATNLWQLATDGTYVYATDQFGGNNVGEVLVWKLTTAFAFSAFLSGYAGNNVGSLYYDGADLWLTSRYGTGQGFWQLSLAGAVLNSWNVTINQGGGLLNNGTYWISGEGVSGGGNGYSYAPVSSPGTWTNDATGDTPSLFGRSSLAGGLAWYGDTGTDITSVTPGTWATNLYAPFTGASQQTGQLAWDGTNLWATNSNSTIGGIWQTTPGSPLVGTLWGFSGGAGGAGAIIYNAPTQTLWACGANIPGGGIAGQAIYSLDLAPPGDPIRMLL